MRKFYYISASILIVIFILIQGKFLMAPLVLSVIFGILVAPFVNKMERKKIPPVVAASAAVIVFFSLLIGVAIIILNQYYSMLDQMPSFSRKLTSVIEKVSTLIAERTDLSPQRLTELLDKGRVEVSNTITGGFAEVFQSFSSFISFVFILPIFTFLIVLYRHSITVFVSTLGISNSTAKKTWTETLADIKKVVLKYSSGLLIVIIILATLNTLGLLILGIPFALILGVSSAVLTVVPYIGNFLGGSLAVLVAFVMKDDPMYALYVFLLYMGVQILEGNLITPKIMGKQMGVNPLVVIIALLAGGFIWGVVGMIISVPIVAVIKVLMERKEELLPLVELMKEDD